jgi:hypothetical protein
MGKTLRVVLALVMALTMVMGSVTTVSAKGKPGTINVTEVSLDKHSISIRVGESDNLTATIAPPDATNQKVSWTTSNKKVATVGKGSDLTTTVTAVAAGTANITVKTADGKFTDTCSVTVEPPAVPITDIGPISGAPVVWQTLTAGNLTPPGATATYQWQSCVTVNGTYSDISGATSNTYDLVPADKDQYVRVSATGYGDYTGTVASEPVLITETPLYTITFDNTNGLSGVEITIHDYWTWNVTGVTSTNATGQATVDLQNGEYAYEATKSGYAWYGDYFEVEGSGQTISFALIPGYTVTFNETNGLPGVDIVIYLEEYGPLCSVTTNATGQATIDLANGDYSYEATRSGYALVLDYFTVSGFAQSVNFTMIPAYTVTLDEANDLPDVFIEIYDSSEEFVAEVSTDASGNATVDLANGTYGFWAHAEGCFELDGNFTVSGEPLTVPFEMFPWPWVTFNETNGLPDVYIGVYRDSALTDMAGDTRTDEYGQATMEMQETGTYYYEAAAYEYGNLIGNFTVSVSNITVSFAMNAGYTVEFQEANLVVAVLQLFSDSDLTIVASSRFTTDAYGNGFIDLQDGTYYYKATKIGFDDCTGNLTVSGAPLSVPFEMIPTPGVLFAEDFQSAPWGELPDGWTTTDTSHCRVEGSDHAGGYRPELALWWTGGPDTYCDYYVATPPINATAVSTALDLSFKSYFNMFGDDPGHPYTYAVQTSDNGGANWTTVLEESPDFTEYPDGEIGPETINIDISACAGTTFRICWRLYGYTYWMNDWCIDDVLVRAGTGEPLTGIGPISGTPEVEQTLTAGNLTPAGATATYQWQWADAPAGNYTNISGATSNTYVLTTADLAKYIRVVATGSGSYTGQISTDPTSMVTTPLTGIGAITGTPEVGQTLTAGNLTPPGATATYQWQRADSPAGTYTDIPGATSNTYVLITADLGNYIRVVVTGSGSYTGEIPSDPTSMVTTPLTGIGSISGTPEVGQTLAAGALSPAGATATYQWQRSATVDGTYDSISGANSSTYVLIAGDVGCYIKVTATGTGAYTGQVTSLATAEVTPVLTPLTAIGQTSGSPIQGDTFTAGALTPAGATATYQWQRCATIDGTYLDIPGATSNNYGTVAGDVGKYIKVEATGSGVYTGQVVSEARKVWAAGPLFVEDFYGVPLDGESLPAGWNLTGTTSQLGYVNDGYDAGGEIPELQIEYDWGPGQGEDLYSDYRVSTSTINATALSTSLRLSFKSYLSIWEFSDDYPFTIAVEVSTDGGTTWNATDFSITINASSEATYPDYEIPARTETVDLSDYVGQEIMISWRMYQYTFQAYTWNIDDVVVAAVYPVTFNETNGLGGVDIYVYSDPDRTVSVDFLTTNSSGQGASFLADATYYYTAVKDSYADLLGDFAVSGAPLTESFTMAPEIFGEDFTGVEAGQIPVGWNQTTEYPNWGVSIDWSYAGGTAPEMVFSFAPEFEGTSRLVTPEIDATAHGGIQLNFKHLIDNYLGGYDLKVQVSVDGGANWTDAWSVSPTGGNINIGPATETVDLSAYDGQTFRLAWVFDGNSYNIDCWDIDDISVTVATGEPLTGIGPISGTPEVGQTLTAGNLTPPGATATYQWQSCATVNGTYSDISGATSNTYDLVSADEDQYVRVSATGYGDYTGTVASEPVLVTGLPLYTVTFNETNDVSDVDIDVYDDEWNYIDYVTTNSSGEATIQLPDGDYYYDAYCGGYAEIYDEPFSVSGTDTTVDFEMVPYIYIVTFNVTDADSGYPVSEVEIDIYDDEWNYIDYVTTDSDGEATIELQDGDYYYDAGCYGYVDISDGYFTVYGTDMTVDFGMDPYYYTVTFEATDGNGGAPIEDVPIEIYDYDGNWVDTVYTDSYGEATAELRTGSYYYDVTSPPAGYDYTYGKADFDVYSSDSTEYLVLWLS